MVPAVTIKPSLNLVRPKSLASVSVANVLVKRGDAVAVMGAQLSMSLARCDGRCSLLVVLSRLSTAFCRVLKSAPPTSAQGTMQVLRQVLMQVHQYFDGSDVALLPSVLLVIGSKFA